MELLKALAEINAGQIHVYTTNYDCSFQVLATNSTEITFLTHIDSENGRFRENWYSSSPSAKSETSHIYVHRLHGCVGWFNESAAPNQGTIVREVYGAGSDLEIDDDDFLDQMCIKLIASQLIGTNPAFASAFEEFCSDLRKTKLLLVWGYSFRDLEVVRAINHAFSERKFPLQILYLNPFLPEARAIDTIERTLLQAPIQLAGQFRPRKIAWTPIDGLANLVPAIIKSIKGVLENDEST
jgi:hypothetical protein